MTARPPVWVNWKNPMLLSDEHLRQADASQTRARQWLARILMPPGGGYGLTAQGPSGGHALDVRFELNGLRLDVVLESIAALAPDGTALVYDATVFPELRGGLQTTVELERNPAVPQTLAVLVEPLDASGEDQSAWIELGDPGPDEDPPRAPYRIPALRLVVEEGETSRLSRLRVAQYTWNGATVEADPTFLPPARSTLATSAWRQRVDDLRREVQRLRQGLQQGMVARAEGSVFDEAMLWPWIATVSSLEEIFPESTADSTPREIWQAARRVLRVSNDLIHTREAARSFVFTEFVQPGKTAGSDPFWFDTLGHLLSEAYEHEEAGPALDRIVLRLRDLNEIVAFVLGNVAKKKDQLEPGWIEYDGQKYRPVPYQHRLAEDRLPGSAPGQGLFWCHVTGIEPQDVEELIVVVSSELTDKTHSNAKFRLDTVRNERYMGFPPYNDQAEYDRTTMAGMTLVRFRNGFRTSDQLREISLMSQAFDFTKLGAHPDDMLRIYAR